MRTHLTCKTVAFTIALICILFVNTKAQFDINGQLVQRAEYRHGFGKLIPAGAEPAGFISQRARLQATYKLKGLRFYTSVQDIRTWGNTAQTKISDGFLSLHEGWAEIAIDSAWAFKAGRQELNYDNARFLGNLDWAMQARAHDFALLKYEKNKNRLHLGGGYNQTAENLTGNAFTLTNQYKTAQMIWFNHKNKDFEFSFLCWNNGRESLKYDAQGNVTSHDLRFSQTIGVPTIKKSLWKNNMTSAFAYYQTGKDVSGKSLNAYDVSIQTSQNLDVGAEKKTLLKFTLGAELLSGTNSNNKRSINNSFSPMYGTNHAHNGYMDYYYVGGRFENFVGLNDLYLRARYDAGKKWFAATDVHYFSTNELYYSGNQALSRQLGAEADITCGITFSEDVSVQAGYSQLFAAGTLKTLQAASAQSVQNWAYLMLIIRPKNDKKYIGLIANY